MQLVQDADSVGKRCLPDLLAEQVRARPDAAAVVYGDEVLTYRELAERSDRLALYLRHLGVDVDDCVGMFVEPSIDLMVAAWGILSAGSAYCPLSPEYPEERIRYMIEDRPVKIVFTQEKLRAKLTELAPMGTTIITLDDAAAFDPGDSELGTGLRPNHVAYVIYTSGSTGKPKGVMIEHRSIVNQMRWLNSAHGLNGDTVILQKTPMSFDAAQWEILAPSCGATVVMGAPGIYRDPERLVDTIIEHGVTTLQCVPTLLQALLHTEEMHNCTSLRRIYCGAEALSRILAVECLETLPWCQLVNLYGPTECTINTSSHVVDPKEVRDGPATIPIGAPADGTQYYILDERRSPLSVGEVGELYIGGVQLARGYLHRPDLTADRFVDNPFGGSDRLYRTGDLTYWNPDGTVQFIGRTDNQVKLRGFRVELDEIRLAIENHEWVKNAAAVVKSDARTGFQNLYAFIELNPKEAALMDQGNHGAHHQSKESKVAIKAQLAALGRREPEELAGKPHFQLAGAEPTPEQVHLAFSRKTYRFFEGGADVTKADILDLLGKRSQPNGSRGLDEVNFDEFGEMMRYFGQFRSPERLLPKYAYASPGSLYATQIYLETAIKICDLKPGYYYYDPQHHQLVLIRLHENPEVAETRVKMHFLGKRRAIEPVYRNNIQEVLEIETGHMIGLLEEILPGYGLDIRAHEWEPEAKQNLECADEDYYLGTFEVHPYAGEEHDKTLEVYVQSHTGRVADLPAGQYRYNAGELERISDELVQRKHVIAINQQVYERASIGIAVISRSTEDWMSYIDLGRKLQRLQMNDLHLGFMSAGYSSKTGADLPAAKRMESILKACGIEHGPCYFFVGGRISDEQLRSVGMKEDVVHMKGPAEIIKDDLLNLLPDYMIPNRVIVLDALPLTANGKIDLRALESYDDARLDYVDRPFVAPRTETEQRVVRIWRKEMKRDVVSVHDDFFESGGNSLIAVVLVNKLNREFGSALPVQVMFEAPTVEKLAQRLEAGSAAPASRLVRLHPEGTRPPIYCWPGLGGYTMNLRLLARKVGPNQPFYGVQAYGINKGEVPYPTIREMAAEDVTLIKRMQPDGPYTLWGYSFGARVAFEAAYQLEQAGDRVAHLFLIAPGSPKVRQADASAYGRDASYTNRAYVTILFSVFAGSITGPLLEECLAVTTDAASFTAFICAKFPDLDPDLIGRIVEIVHRTYQFEYTFAELVERRINAPVTIFKARGDDYSFIENTDGYSDEPPTVIELEADHYSLLKEPDIEELMSVIRDRQRAARPIARQGRRVA
jgi:amino acid adenylation domain-containing protein